MKFLIKVIILTFLSMNLLLAGKAVKTEEDRSVTLADNVALDPSTGENVFTNQLMLAFKSSISPEERELILREQGFKVLSSSPTLNIYHVTFANPDASLAKLLQIRDTLQKNPKFLYVYLHRPLQSARSTVDFLKDNELQRKGEITIRNAGDHIRSKPRTVNEVILEMPQSIPAATNLYFRLSRIFWNPGSLQSSFSSVILINRPPTS